MCKRSDWSELWVLERLCHYTPKLFKTGLFAAERSCCPLCRAKSGDKKKISTFPTRNTRLGFCTNDSKCNYLKVCQRNELLMKVTEKNSDTVFDLKANTYTREHKRRHKHITKDNNKLLTSSSCTKKKLQLTNLTTVR